MIQLRIVDCGFRIVLLIALCAICACGAPMKNSAAAKALSQATGLPAQQIQVTAVSGMGGTLAVDASVKMTFILQKDKSGQWTVVKVKRFGSGQWEDPDKIPELLSQNPPAQ